MTRILVLTAGFGDGHNTAAHSIREALEQSPGNNQVEVVDLFRHSYGLLNTVARQTYYGLINHAPSVWGGIFWLLDRTARWKYSSTSLGRATRDLAALISQTNPDCVLATYPAYTPMIEAIYPDARHRPFLLGVVVTDSITVNAAWYAAPADFYCVANEQTGAVLERAGVAAGCIHAFGFPVSARFAEPADPADEWEPGRTFRILQILNHGTRKAVKTARRLLAVPRSHLTIVAGRNPKLRRKLEAATADQADRVTVLGWTDRIPELMRQSHLIVTKAGGATVQEALAAGRPVILTQVVPGQEEGNAEFVRAHGMGAVARRPKEVGRIVVQALKHRGYQFRQWRRNVERQHHPHAARKLAGYVLHDCRRRAGPALELPEIAPRLARPRRPRCLGSPQGLLCDFHAHSTYSDGRLELPEVVSFYGRQGFDVLCITDHIADPRRLIGRLGERLLLTLSPKQVAEYFDLLERERRRAWMRYGMLLFAGLEFNKEGFTAGNSTHLLGVGLHAPIDPSLPLREIMAHIRQQDGLVIAPHPHRFPHRLAKNTLHLWNHRDEYRPLIDAWEIANRNHIFSPVGLEGLPYIAGSDFHQPAHIRSWKTLLFCEKDPQAVKAAIRRNQGVGLVFYEGPRPQTTLPATVQTSTVLRNFRRPSLRNRLTAFR